MTEELNLLREALRRVKHEAASLADAQVIALEALTQRPAAQADDWRTPTTYAQRFAEAVALLCREMPPADMVAAWIDRSSGDHSLQDWACERAPAWAQGIGLLDAAHVMADQPTEGVNHEPTQPAAQDEREADEVFLPRRLAATQKLTQLGYRYDSAHGKWLPAPQQATPEPVGEVFQFPPMPEGWPARFRCDSCDGNGELGELVSMGDFQPPERQTCPDCGGRGWTSEEPAFNAEHMREFAETHARCTRPAPGVPEGFALVPVEPTAEMMEAMPSLPAIGAPGDMELKANGWSLKAIQNRHRWRAALAAAQAKGADK